MEINVYDTALTPLGIIDKISSLIWTRRYWQCGEFKLLVPFTEKHADLLQKGRLVMKRGGDEAAQIRYVNINKNSQGVEEIEVQGKMIACWLDKRIVRAQIVTTDTTQNILCRIVRENVTNPTDTARDAGESPDDAREHAVADHHVDVDDGLCPHADDRGAPDVLDGKDIATDGGQYRVPDPRERICPRGVIRRNNDRSHTFFRHLCIRMRTTDSASQYKIKQQPPLLPDAESIA